MTSFRQIEANDRSARRRQRTGGEQRVTVQHVTVGEGGKANRWQPDTESNAIAMHVEGFARRRLRMAYPGQDNVLRCPMPHPFLAANGSTPTMHPELNKGL
jgi:hypothetical protein